MPAEVFLGYPSRPPMLRETMANAAAALNALGDVHVTLWEDLKVDGRVLWDAIASAIDAADVTAFDVTHPNANVYFELGYALGRNKPIWPLRDSSDAAARSAWDQLGSMLTIGYVSYTNSEDIRAKFLADRPDIQRARFFEEAVQPHLEPRTAPSVLHLAGAVETEASRALSRAIRAAVVSGLSVVTADPTEASFQPLTWYAQHVYNAYAVIAHMGVSRHGCGQGERAIVVLSRIFVLGKDVASRTRVDRAAGVDALTRRSPPGATFIARQRSWAGQSRMA